MAEHGRPADQSRGGVGFVFGLLDAEAVPGPILVSLMSDLGYPEATTRQLLARMLRQGELTRQRVGRLSVYRMAGRYLELWLLMRHGSQRPAWRGYFDVVLHDVPEQHRRQREALQTLATRAGFGQLRPGVLVGLRPPDFVAELPAPSGLVESGRLDVDLDAARRIAATAWRLSARAEELREAKVTLQRLLVEVRQTPPDGAAALPRLFQAVRLASAPHHDSPVMPGELLPRDWPAEQVHEALGAVIAQLQPRVGAYLYEQLSRSPHAGLIVGGWWKEAARRASAG